VVIVRLVSHTTKTDLVPARGGFLPPGAVIWGQVLRFFLVGAEKLKLGNSVANIFWIAVFTADIFCFPPAPFLVANPIPREQAVVASLSSTKKNTARYNVVCPRSTLCLPERHASSAFPDPHSIPRYPLSSPPPPFFTFFCLLKWYPPIQPSPDLLVFIPRHFQQSRVLRTPQVPRAQVFLASAVCENIGSRSALSFSMLVRSNLWYLALSGPISPWPRRPVCHFLCTLAECSYHRFVL